MQTKFRFLSALCAAGLLVSGANAAPVITSFTPTFGSSIDPNFITIHGSGFTPGALVVRFGGPGGTQDPTAAATSSSTIQAQVPAGAALGPGKIYVSVGGQATVSLNDFTVIGPGPYISNFTPAGGNASTLVTINGAHFAAAGTLTIRFNGVAVPPGNITSVADNQIQVLPPASVTTGLISVGRSGTVGNYGVGTNVSATNFFVNPVITGFSPSSGRTGTNVMIRGTNFTGALAVTFNGTSVPFTVTNNNTIGVTLPAGLTTGPILVQTPAPNPGFTTSNFVIMPTVFGFAPDAGPVGTSVTVTGANFNVTGLAVRFGGVLAAAPTGVTFGSLTAVVPNGATNAPITVTTAHGSNTSSQIFHLPARITGFAPTNSAPGSTVQITGSNFLGANAVTFNGTAASFTVSNNTVIGAIVPAGVITGPITVTTPAGTTNSGNKLFYGAPVITGFTPTHGLPGTNVTLLGTNFLGATAVRFNGTNAAFSVVNDVLTATVPANATTGPISVTGPAGTSASASPFILDYSSDLGVTVTAPGSVLLTSNFTYVIVVTNKGPFAAPNVVLTNILPDTVVLNFASTTQGSLVTSGNPITGNLGTLGVGGSATVTLTVTPQVTGVITNRVTVAGAFDDPIPANNSSSTATTIYVVPLLSIQRQSTNTVQLSWSVSLSEYILQYSGNLSSTSSWSNVLTTPEFIGDQKVVVDPIGTGARWYRLAR